jgi:hypothetical protein
MHAWEGRCGILDDDQICSDARMLTALSFPAERKSPLLKLQMWNVVLSMRQYSQLLPNFRFRFPFHFRFRLCASFRGGSVFRDPPYTSTSTDTSTDTGTSRNHFASLCFTSLHDATSSMGPTPFDGETEADSGPDGNQTVTGPLGAKHVPVARHCHDIVTLDES